MVKKNNNNVVLNYFNTIGLKTVKNRNKFWDNIEINHGKAVHDHINHIMDSRNELYELEELNPNMVNNSIQVENIYEIVNQNLKLSIDFSNLTADFIRRFLEWFVQYKLETNPKKILEIGCDNGITTCFLALQFPTAEVVGIDISKNGIDRARELADKLGISNVKFISTDFKTFNEEYKDDNEFDIIVSLRTMHELTGYPPDPKHFSTKEFIEKLNLTENMIITSIKTLLKDSSSKYISCERLPYIESYAYWSELLIKSKLYINWNEAAYNRSFELNETQTMPIFVASGTNQNVTTFDGIVKFTNSVNKDNLNSFTKVTDIIAEEFINKIPDKVFIRGVQINWLNGSGCVRLECWKDSSFVYLYKYSTLSFRELKKYKLEEETIVFEEIELFMDYNASPIYTESFTYQTIGRREELNKQI